MPKHPIDDWREHFDERERKEIEHALHYVENYDHGTPGHQSLRVIAKLATILDEYACIDTGAR